MHKSIIEIEQLLYRCCHAVDQGNIDNIMDERELTENSFQGPAFYLPEQRPVLQSSSRGKE